MEGKQQSGDDTAATGLKLTCISGESYITSNIGCWGSWQGYKSGINGLRICGIHTRVEEYKGEDDEEDDTALNGADLM